MPTTIYMPLLNEGTDVWAPVSAELVGEAHYRVLGPVPDGQQWRFHPGSAVRVAQHSFASGDSGLAVIGAAYECWFCGRDIDGADGSAVVINVGGLWRWDAGSTTDDDPWQQIYAHSMCAKDRLHGAKLTFEPEIFEGE